MKRVLDTNGNSSTDHYCGTGALRNVMDRDMQWVMVISMMSNVPSQKARCSMGDDDTKSDETENILFRTCISFDQLKTRPMGLPTSPCPLSKH